MSQSVYPEPLITSIKESFPCFKLEGLDYHSLFTTRAREGRNHRGREVMSTFVVVNTLPEYFRCFLRSD